MFISPSRAEVIFWILPRPQRFTSTTCIAFSNSMTTCDQGIGIGVGVKVAVGTDVGVDVSVDVGVDVAVGRTGVKVIVDVGAVGAPGEQDVNANTVARETIKRRKNV